MPLRLDNVVASILRLSSILTCSSFLNRSLLSFSLLSFASLCATMKSTLSLCPASSVRILCFRSVLRVLLSISFLTDITAEAQGCIKFFKGSGEVAFASKLAA